jgi:hypothetical protein
MDGTISGTVRGPQGAGVVAGRSVAVVDVVTGEGQQVNTNSAGGFTVKVKPGKYRVQLTLREGESIVQQPGVIDVNRSALDAHADFVLANGRISRPFLPAYRGEARLGAPIA